jgi:transcriptional activator HAC1
MTSDDIDPTQLMYLSHYPSPEAEPQVQPQLEQPPKKKRKAWGQPVPEINPILPPRKRAKTAEEKEQRKNERILRNRRAADKSRQRQKAAVAELEITKSQMEEENATLRALLEQYRSRFGDIEGFTFSPAPPSSTPLPIKTERLDSYPAATPVSYHTEFDASTMAGTPSIAPNSPAVVVGKVSPSLAPTLFPTNDQQAPDFEHHEVMASDTFGTDVSGMTQYPAVILCDLQCQPEMLDSNFSMVKPNFQEFNQFIQTLVKLNLMTIYDMFSTTMLSPMYQIFQILVRPSLMTSTCQDFSNFLDNHFTLLHSLISSRTTATNPKVIFRTKLLSRLLACSPRMARLLLAATDRELQRVVEDEAFAEDPEVRALWASLLTMKWVIVRLEREHRRYRRLIYDEVVDSGHLDGVDYEAVARSSGRWRDIKIGNHSELYEYNACMTGLEVH